MPLDTEVLSTLTGIDHLNAIAAEVLSLPYDQRRAAVRAYQRILTTWEAAELKYNWNLHARESRISKARCVPGLPTSVPPTPPTAPTHSSTPSPS